MKLWRWEKGRQKDCEYKKFTLWYFRIWNYGFDAYILKYQPKSILPMHNDPVKDGEHHRFNLPIWGDSTFYWLGGGEVINDRYTIWLRTKGAVRFRPDIQKHFMNVGERGCIKLSFGFVKFKK